RGRKRDGDFGLDFFGGRGTATAAAARRLLAEDVVHIKGRAPAEELTKQVCCLRGVHFLRSSGPRAPLEFEPTGSTTAAFAKTTSRPRCAEAIVLDTLILVAQNIVR